MCILQGWSSGRAVYSAFLGSYVKGDAKIFSHVHLCRCLLISCAYFLQWMISGTSLFEYDRSVDFALWSGYSHSYVPFVFRPIEKVSIAQYSALTLTGFFFSRYAMLVTPINYMLCSVNVALFGSSAYHLSRKIKADYM